MIEGLVTLMIAHEVANQKIQLDKLSTEYKTSQAASSNTAVKYNVSFDVSSRGILKGDVNEFANMVESTLTDSRGWIRAGVKFSKVSSG